MNTKKLQWGRTTPARLFLLIACTGALSLFASLAFASHASAYVPAGAAIGEQWDLLNSAQFSGSSGDDIDATRAWDLERGGNASVLVGLVDSGVDYDQPSLEHANLYTQGAATHAAASGQAAAAARTRTCAASLYGCSFLGGEGGTPSDDSGHGTATTGEIFAGWEAGAYAGLAPESTLIVAKVLNASDSGSTASEAEGLDYVADRGARVVNVSIAGAQSATLHEAIASHPETLFVAAAGNAGVSDDGSSASYPCADPAPNVICVAASDTNDQLALFSNYGSSSVDLAAPGVHIATLTREGSSNAFNGTSFAAPLVTGTVALAFAARPQATVAEVKQAILESVDHRSGLSGKTLTGGRLNAYRALSDLIEMLPAAPPSSISAPTVSGTPALGATLTASAGEWSESPTATTVSWERCDREGGHCQLIAGADGATYQPTATDTGHRLRAEVIATNAAGGEVAFSASTRPVGASGEAGAEASVAPSAQSQSIAAGTATDAPASVGSASPAAAPAQAAHRAAVKHPSRKSAHRAKSRRVAKRSHAHAHDKRKTVGGSENAGRRTK
jgi:hypothetical protein